MKILHTADWHLGKRLDRFSRLEEQIAVMEEIIKIADNEQPHAVLIAGDLFDNFNPTTEALELFYNTLHRLSNYGRRAIIAIAGNHDSPALIDAPVPLAKASGIILIGNPKTKVAPFKAEGFELKRSDIGFLEIIFTDVDFPLRIFHTAYANEVRLKEYFSKEKSDSLQTSLTRHWQELNQNYANDEGFNVLLTHLFMQPSSGEVLEEQDGEKSLKIGNAELISTLAIPQNIHYTALGHLHSFKNIGSEQKPIVYASSPLQYSFSEAYQQKYVVLINCELPSKGIQMKAIPLERGKKLERKTFPSVGEAIFWLNDNPNCWVELTIETDNYFTLEERAAIEQAHNSVVFLIPKRRNTSSNETLQTSINLNESTMELFKLYYQSINNMPAADDLLDVFNELL